MEISPPAGAVMDTNIKSLKMEPRKRSTAEFAAVDFDESKKPQRGMSFKELIRSKISGSAISIQSNTMTPSQIKKDAKNKMKIKLKKKMDSLSESS
jgi:hypothetical protein